MAHHSIEKPLPAVSLLNLRASNLTQAAGPLNHSAPNFPQILSFHLLASSPWPWSKQLITSFSSSSSIFAGESGAQAERVEVAPDPDRMMLLLPCRPLPPDCESAGAAWLQVNPCGDAAVCPDTRVGRENQLARVWALDGARHTSEIASWRVVSRRVRGFMGSWSWGLWGQVMCCRVWRLSLVWAQEGARHTSEMPKLAL